MRPKFFYLLLLLALPAKADERLVEADKLYAAGEFAKARQIYREELKPGRPAAFYYNFGTAALRAGAFGEAHTALWRSALSSPFASDARANLALARAKLAPSALGVRPANWIAWWPEILRPWPWAVWLCAGLALLAPFLYLAQGGLLPGQWGLLAGAVFFLSAAALAFYQQEPGAAGLLVNTKVLSGPAKSYPEITSIEAGSLVSLEESRDGWVKIRYLDSRLQETVGWVESPTVLKLDGGT